MPTRYGRPDATRRTSPHKHPPVTRSKLHLLRVQTEAFYDIRSGRINATRMKFEYVVMSPARSKSLFDVGTICSSCSARQGCRRERADARAEDTEGNKYRVPLFTPIRTHRSETGILKQRQSRFSLAHLSKKERVRCGRSNRGKAANEQPRAGSVHSRPERECSRNLINYNRLYVASKPPPARSDPDDTGYKQPHLASAHRALCGGNDTDRPPTERMENTCTTACFIRL